MQLEQAVDPDDTIASIAAEAAAGAGQRADVVADFVRATLRRVTATSLALMEVASTAAWLREAFEWVDRSPPLASSVRIVEPVGAAGRHGTVVEVTGSDRAFLLSTVTRTIEAAGARVVERLHPILGTQRDRDGRLREIGAARHAEHREAFLHLQLDRHLTDDPAEALHVQLTQAMRDVTAVTDDHDRLRARLRDMAGRARTADATDGDDAPADVADLLDWLLDANLVVLGWRAYDLSRRNGKPSIVVAPGSGLGLLREASSSRFATPTPVASLDEPSRTRLDHAPLLRCTTTRRRATVHDLRPMLDFVLTWRNDQGEPVRIERVLGLFTSAGLAVPSVRVPVLASRLQVVLDTEDIVAGSHDETAVIALFQSVPKDELLQCSVPELRDLLLGLWDVPGRGRVRAVVRIDAPTRTVSVVVAVSSDQYTPQLRQRLCHVVEDRIGSPAEADVAMGRPEAGVVLRLRARPADDVTVDAAALEGVVVSCAQPWTERVRTAIGVRDDPAPPQWQDLLARLPASYRTRTDPDRVGGDLVHLDRMLTTGAPRAAWLTLEPRGGTLRIAQQQVALVLSDAMPVLDSLGLVVDAEHSHLLRGPGPTVHLHDFRVDDPWGALADAGPNLTDTILEALAGRFEVDGLNRLALRAGLSPRGLAIVRAYRRYRRQVGTSYSAEYTNDALAEHPAAVRAILDVFELRFNPDRPGTAEDVAAATATAHAACDAIERLDHDRIVRGVLHLVEATLRTTAFMATPDSDRGWTEDAAGRWVPVLAFKFDPARVPDIPEPVPHREIFVSSPAVEGLHLRAGPIARGGLRFSDRQDDLRTEILGLMKAQVLKNALIVPTGAKGGFVCKRLPAEPAAARTDVRRQYVAFISALLDVTDDVDADGAIIPPPRVRRHDGDDPYLVVAADKGTATFSDLANEVAESRGFWLGDAFASGGHAGYDHKVLAITARGAWTVISRHFGELGMDLQTDPVTVAGVGDMSGDVFGNGMLLSRSLRLIAAFDHRDIFIDPDPDPVASFAERQRLATLPGSSWQDYDRDVLSEGGMVVSRAAKTLEVTPAVRARLDLAPGPATPSALLKAVLACQVDLLWFGGIGTYVKATTETHLDIADRANDEVRIDASRVRARVVGEGANLAVSPRARIQYARRGGRIDQDAVHNAAGVDSSDHEVNLKILLGMAVMDGRLDRPARDGLLADVTEDVVAHVLRDVDRQAAQLSRLAATSAARLDDVRMLLADLETRGTIDREVDVLPDLEELDTRATAGAGLTRPELATLMGAAKRVVDDTLRASTLPDDPVVAECLTTYFPDRVLADFGDLVPRHRLCRELVSTIAANDLVDRLGPTWPFHLAVETGSGLDAVLAATLAAWHVIGATHWWQEWDIADAILPPERSQPLATTLSRLVMGIARRYLDDPLLPDVAALVARDRDTFGAMGAIVASAGPVTRTRRHRAAATQLTDDLIAPDLADLLAGAADLALIVDVADVARTLNTDPAAVTDAMLQLAATLGLDRLGALVEHVPVDTEWQRRERKGLTADVQRLHAAALRPGITVGVTGLDPDRRARVDTLLSEVESLPQPPLSAVSVLVRAFADLLDARG